MFDPVPISCSAPLCGSLATIIHGEKPYCGRHALAALEAEQPTSVAKSSVPEPETATDEPKESRSHKTDHEAGPGEPQPFIQIGDQKEKAS